jgi:hypothetical protein
MVINSTDYLKAFRSSIARISHANGVVVGAGFLVSPQYALTCAHVVTQALGLPQNTTETPAGSIDLDFPLIAAGQKIKAEVIFWRPVNLSAVGEDIAGLKLEGDLPETAQPVRLVAAEDWWDHPLRVFGFPSGHNDGAWAAGVLRGERGNGWVQMEAVNVPGYRVEPGFSGAPVWDETLSGVVGMAVAAERQREGVKAAFMIPTKLLTQAWSELGQWVQLPTTPRTALNRVQQIKAKVLQGRMDSLSADYEAAYNQLNYTLSEVDRNRIKRQAEFLEQEMMQVENDLNSLNH